MQISKRWQHILFGVLRAAMMVLFFIAVFSLAIEYFTGKAPLILKSLRWLFY